MMTDESVLLKRRTPTVPKSSSSSTVMQSDSTASLSREEKEIQTNSISSTLSTNIENACWLIAAVACAYYSDIFHVLLSDTRIYR